MQVHFSPQGLQILNYILAIVMFGVALDMRWSDFKSIAKMPISILAGLFSQWIVLPALTVALVKWGHPEVGIGLGMLLVAASPGGNVSNFLVHWSGGNTALSVILTSITTFFAAFLTPLIFYTSQYLVYPDAQNAAFVIDFWGMVQTLVVLLIIPLVAGMIVQARFTAFANRIKPYLSKFSMLILVGFIVIAVANNASVFWARWSDIAGWVWVHNALALGLGWVLARYFFKRSVQDAQTIAIETGIQNSGLSLVLIFTFLGGQAEMALVAAWWGVWHIVAGFIFAGFFRRFTKS